MQIERRVRLSRNGRNQGLRIPRVFELPGDEAMLHQKGNRLVIEPVTCQRNLLEILATLQPIDEAFPDTDRELLPFDDVAM